MGLTWRAYVNQPKLEELQHEAEALKLETGWAAVRGNQCEAGFMSAAENEKRPRGIYSLAAAVAGAHREPWLGVYEVAPKKWWLIGIQEGRSILPNGDLIGTYEEVMAVRKGLEGLHDWEYIKGDLGHITQFIQDQGRKISLVPVRSLEPVSPLVPLGTIAGAGMVLGMAGLLWHDHQLVQQHNRARAFAAEQAKILAEERAISPLRRTPAPEEWLSACADSINPLPLAQGGWALSGVSCSSTYATAVWARLDGATVATRPAGVLDDTGNTVNQNIPFPRLQPGPDNARGLDASKVALFTLLQPLGVSVTFSKAGLTGQLPGAAPPPLKVQATEQPVSFTMPVPPFALPLDKIPGLRVTAATVSQDGTWTVSGEIYGR
jgi:Pilin accessory protein (PilO)